MAGLNTRPQWPILLDPTFRSIYNMTEKEIPSEISNIFEVESTSKAYVKDTSVSGLGKMLQKSEGDTIVYTSPISGYPVIYTPKTFALGEAVSYELYSDDETGIIKKAPARLAKARMHTREQFASDLLNFGFVYGGGGDTLFNGGDGQALFSTAHPRKDGGAVQSNYTTAALSEDALEAGMLAMRRTLDQRGEKVAVRATHMIVPPELEKEARILLDSQLRTGTANNDVNPYKGRLQIVVWDYLTSTTAWFLIDASQNPLKWVNREYKGLEGPEYDFDTKSAKWSVVDRFTVGFSDWRGIYGSTGTNA